MPIQLPSYLQYSLCPSVIGPCHCRDYHVSSVWWHMSNPYSTNSSRKCWNWVTCVTLWWHHVRMMMSCWHHLEACWHHISYMLMSTLTLTMLTFYLFGKTNKMWYLSHTMFVWAHSSCIRFISTRPMHTYVLNPFWALWFLVLPGPILVPRSILEQPPMPIPTYPPMCLPRTHMCFSNEYVHGLYPLVFWYHFLHLCKELVN
jgi:hypothetical protein